MPQESICFDDTNDGAGNFDLIEAYIARMTDDSGYVFNAVALGPSWDDRDWGYSFTINDFEYVVVAGRYRDGTINTFAIGPGTPDDNVIPEDQTFVFEGAVNVVLSNDWLRDVAGTPFDWEVLLVVDGIEVDACSVTAFGQTGEP